MRLNHDCIRDILLYVEDNTTYENSIVEAESLISDMKSKYNEDMINYHIAQLDDAELLSGVEYSDDAPECIYKLSWKGHQYIDNIRDNKVWSKLKDMSKSLASVSLPVLIEKAPDIAKLFLSNS